MKKNKGELQIARRCKVQGARTQDIEEIDQAKRRVCWLGQTRTTHPTRTRKDKAVSDFAAG